jgi:hypothetical protein
LETGELVNVIALVFSCLDLDGFSTMMFAGCGRKVENRMLVVVFSI